MAVKNYMINDKWLDIAKQNILEVESTDGVIGSVKVNGQEYGGGGGSDEEFKLASITWVNMPETFDNYDPRSALLLIKTADDFEDYFDVYEFSEVVLVWEDEWSFSPKTIVSAKQPENVGDIAVWLQPYPDHNFSVVSGDAIAFGGGVILYGDCTLTIA